MRITNKRILALLSTAAFVVVASPVNALTPVSGELTHTYTTPMVKTAYGVYLSEDGAGVTKITHLIQDGAELKGLTGGINLSIDKTTTGNASLGNGTGSQLNLTSDTLKDGIEIKMTGGTVTGQIFGGNAITEGGPWVASWWPGQAATPDEALYAKYSQEWNVGSIIIDISGGSVGSGTTDEAIMGGGGRYCGTANEVSIKISGTAEIHSDVFAGSNGGTVKGTAVEISGGVVNGDVYGGGRKSYNSVTDTAAISISGGSVNGDVYGAGNAGTVGSTEITMTGNTSSVSGTIYGGGGADGSDKGTVLGSKTIDLGTDAAAYSGTVRLADFTDVNVNNGTTTIESLADVTNVTVGSAGVLNIDASTLQVDNAVTVNGTLNVDMQGDDAGASGKTLTLGDGSTVNVLNAIEGTDAISVFGFDTVEASDNVTLTLNGASVSSSMWSVEDGTLTIKEATATTLNLTRNQTRFYDSMRDFAAEGNAPEMIVEMANSRDEAALKEYIDSISGHEYATAMSSQLEGNMAHLRRLRGAMGKGQMLGRVTDAKMGTTSMPSPWRAGVSVFHDETNIDTDASGDGYDRSETGALVNVEYLTQNNVTLGGAISYGRTNLRPDAGKRRHENNTRFDVYALYGQKRWSFATSLGMGLHEHEISGMFGGTDVDGLSVNFMQDVAYTVLSNDKNTVQVFGTLETSWNEIDSFQCGPLAGDNQDAWATVVTAGLRYSRTLSALGNAPAGVFTVQTGVTASVGDVKSALHLTPALGNSWTQECATRNRWGWNLGAGVDVPVSQRTSVYGAAEAVLRGDSSSVDAQVGVKVAF